MPHRVLKCDFCESEFRKDGLAVHIRAKHMDSLVRYLVEDAKEHAVSPILQFMKKQPATSIPIPSRLHGGCDYWFGVKPVIIEEKDSVAPYIAVEVNVKAHEEFLREAMGMVSIVDYMEIQRELCNKSPEMKALEKSIRDTTSQYLRIQEEFLLYREKSEADLSAYKQTVEQMNGGKTLAMMTREIESLQRTNRRMEDKIIVLTRDTDRLRKHNEPAYRSEVEAMDNIKMEELYIQKIETLQTKLAKVREELQTEKDKNAKIKAKKAKTHKDSQKRREMIEKVRRDEQELKKNKKALKMDLESESDNDSSSGDDD